VENPLL